LAAVYLIDALGVIPSGIEPRHWRTMKWTTKPDCPSAPVPQAGQGRDARMALSVGSNRLMDNFG